MKRVQEILERPTEVGRLLFEKLEKPLSLLEDELDPAILEKLLVPSAISAASVHKYWTSAFDKAADNAELLEMKRVAEMYTSQSHVLNCELYKVLVMKIDKRHSTVMGAEDIDKLRSKNKTLRSRLAVSEDVRAKAEYKINMAETIQKFSVKARKQTELKLKLCEDMAHAKYKELRGLGGALKCQRIVGQTRGLWLCQSQRFSKAVGIMTFCNICLCGFHQIH
ncbi:hypothetical protein Fot_19958 [Forsythia ovata]|uniref:Uncharacterized protein n=1 Tax=Forsythia ovata TaxID=205694 RepID=A0ABD1VMU9_9LAMI